MSESDDSETAEWEKEQMLRGTQSRGQKYHQPRSGRKTSTVDISATKALVNQDIEKVKASIETIKRSIGSTRLELVRSEKKAEALRKYVDQLESAKSVFNELGTLDDLSEIVNFLEKHKSIISKLPHDQKEMIDLLEKKAKDNQQSMDIDQ